MCHSVLDFLWLLTKNDNDILYVLSSVLDSATFGVGRPSHLRVLILRQDSASLKSSQCSMVEVMVLAVKVLISMQKCCGVLSPNCLSLEDHFNPDWLDFLVSFQDTILN